MKLGQINGVGMALGYALVNSSLALLIAFGVHMTKDEIAAILAFLNNAMVLAAYLAHTGAKHTQPTIPAPPVDQSHG